MSLDLTLWRFLPHRDPVDWQLIRLKASKIVKKLIMQIPKFKHLMKLPRCPVDPCYTIPFGFG